VGRLWTRGVEIDWAGLHRGRTPRRVPLPTYPVQGRPHWVDVLESGDSGEAAAVEPGPGKADSRQHESTSRRDNGGRPPGPTAAATSAPAATWIPTARRQAAALPADHFILVYSAFLLGTSAEAQSASAAFLSII
jgi:acyl transferase domain-containing protein